MGEGPTLVGSIIAELDLDLKKWNLKVGEIKEQSKEVGALDPTVKVDANVGPALAKLEAVMGAEKRLEAAQRAKLNTSGALSLAEMRYEAVMSKTGATDLQVAAAEEALARARRADLAATERSAAATSMLNAVKSEDARKSEEQVAANDKNTESTKRATQANRQNVSALGVAIAMAPAILSAAAPIAASAVGLGAAFGVMGVSGVLAIKGIKDEMASGTSVGNAYSAGLASVTGNLGQLAASSANGMLGAFNQSVGDINARMPFLTQTTGQFAGMLGQLGGTALHGVLDGLQQMNPLLQAGGVELSKFVTWLFSFNGSNGFNEFISYATENLPSVMHLIENLVTTAGHVLAAFAPLGPEVIGLLNGITDGLNSLPLPVLAGLATTATTIAPAIRVAGSAMALFAVESQLAVPVVGLLTAALAGIGIAAATAASGTDQGTQSFKDYTQALKDDNDQLGEHVRMQAAKALSDAGAYDAARTLGVSQTVLTDSLMGVAGAQDILNDAIKRGRAFQNDWSQGVVDANSGAYLATDAQNHMGSAIDLVTKTLDTQKASIERGKQVNADVTAGTNLQTVALQDQAAQYGATVSALQSAEDAQGKQKTAAANATTQLQLENNAAGILKGSLDALNGKALSAAQAQNAFDSSLANMGDHVTSTGKKIHFTTTSITDMSAASVSLRGELNGQIANLQGVVEANGGLANSTGKARAQMVTMRQQIIDNAVAHGVDKDAVTKYIDKLLAIPKSVPPTKLDVDNAAAAAKIAHIQWLLASLHDKTVFVDVQTSDSVNTGRGVAKGSNKPTAYAHGGMVNYLAGGGLPSWAPQGTDTVPAMLSPGEIVIKRASVESIGAGNLLEANRTGKWPDKGQAAGGGTENINVNITAPDRATAKDYFDEARFQIRQARRAGRA